MNVNFMYRQQIVAELQEIPEGQLQELLRMIRDCKLTMLSENTKKKVTPLHGIWKNKISDDIEEPLKEIREDWKKRLGNVDA